MCFGNSDEKITETERNRKGGIQRGRWVLEKDDGFSFDHKGLEGELNQIYPVRSFLIQEL